MTTNEYMVLDEQDIEQSEMLAALEQGQDLPGALPEADDPREQWAATAERSQDAIQAYLNEIGRVPLLSFAEEVELAELIARGEAARQRLHADRQLTSQLRGQLQADIARGEAASQHLIQANLRLVVSIAKKYVGRGLALMDLIQEGNIGLMRAVEKFDPARGNRFSTYATWWIRQAVSRSLAERSRTIRLPVHLTESIGQLKRAADRLSQKLERQPTAEELAAELDLSIDKVNYMIANQRQPISLETPIGDEQDSTLGAFLADPSQEHPIEAASRKMLRQDMTRALSELTERQRMVLTLRYGLEDGQHRTLEDVGKAIGMTRERARQIESEALRQLRSSDTWRHLRDYLA